MLRICGCPGYHAYFDSLIGRCLASHFWLAGNEEMDKKMETAVMGYIRMTVRIHFFIPS